MIELLASLPSTYSVVTTSSVAVVAWPVLEMFTMHSADELIEFGSKSRKLIIEMLNND